MSKAKKQKYVTYLIIAIALYIIATIVALTSFIVRPDTANTATTSDDVFQQQRSELDRWEEYSLDDFKEYAGNKAWRMQDIRIESGNRVSAVVGTDDNRKVLVVRNISKDQARQELGQYGAIKDNTSGTTTTPGWQFISSLLPVVILGGPLLIGWLAYRIYKASQPQA